MKKVRISFCIVVCTNVRTLRAIQVIYIKGVDQKAFGKSSKLRTTKTGGSDPENFGLSRPQLSSVSLPPCCSQFARPEKPTSNGPNQVRMRTLVMRACKKEKSEMPVLKSPPRPPKNETLQLRIEEEVKSKLEKYAEFIDSSESYVVSEALKLLFRKDHDFRTWLEVHAENNEQEPSAGNALFEVARKA